MWRGLSCIILLCSMLVPAWALSEKDLLPQDKAFIASSTRIDATTLNIHIQVADGYYIYRDRIKVRYGQRDVMVSLPAAEQKRDPNFGLVEVYRQAVDLPLRLASPFIAGSTLTLIMQGCADRGVCYPPQTVQFIIGETHNTRAVETRTNAADMQTPAQWREDTGWQRYFNGGIGQTLLFFYLAGIGLAFTACMYPLLPIVSRLIIGPQQGSACRAMGLSCVYVQGMAIIYAGAGILAGLSGELLSVQLQKPWILLVLALFFVMMACAMFGLFQVQMPQRWQSWLVTKTQTLPQGQWVSAALLGGVSALIIGPCMAPPLAASLAYIGKKGDIILGALSLYVLALGVGTPLMLLGLLGQQLIVRLPPWVMRAVQMILGFILLGTALWVAMPVLPTGWSMVLLGLLLFGAAAVLFRSAYITRSGRYRWLSLPIALFLAGGGSVQIAAGLLGGRDILQPLSVFSGPSAVPLSSAVPVDSIASLQAQLAHNRGKIIMLDFYADWCISCKEMEAFTFTDPEIRQLMQTFVILRADVTRNTAEHQALLKAFGLYGPPGILFFKREGELLPIRVIGFQGSSTFLQTLRQIVTEAEQ